jgi:hypothetical protein
VIKEAKKVDELINTTNTNQTQSLNNLAYMIFAIEQISNQYAQDDCSVGEVIIKSMDHNSMHDLASKFIQAIQKVISVSGFDKVDLPHESIEIIGNFFGKFNQIIYNDTHISV